MRKRSLKKYIIITGIVFLIANLFIIIHTYKFTHYNPDITGSSQKTVSLKEMLFGIDLPRPVNDRLPSHNYEEVTFTCNNKKIAAWFIKSDSVNSKGVVLMAHGYNSSKSSLLEKATIFLDDGYDTFLIDFSGVGNSDGNQTTIGYKEAAEVKTAYDYLKNNNNEHIILFGTSMGAASIMKALYDYGSEMNPKGIILECPYSTMLETVKVRFRIMNLPEWIAYPFTFWGGTINNFNAFKLNPINYASSITVPTLLIHGQLDDRVSLNEANLIFEQLNEPKTLKVYLNTGHDNHLEKDREIWINDIREFLDSL